MMDFLKDKDKKNTLKYSLWIGAGVLCVWWVSTLIILISGLDWPQRGQFGDMFGAVNSLFSGLAFAGVIIAIFLQREDIKLTQEEIRTLKEQTKKQNEALDKQIESIGKQNFENTFFKMINLINETVQQTYIQEYKKRFDGLEVFSKISSDIESAIDTTLVNNKITQETNLKLSSLFDRNQIYIRKYLKNLYCALKYVIDECPNYNYIYNNIIQSQLSQNELKIIFYYGIINTDYKYLIEKSHLFFEVFQNDDTIRQAYIEQYADSAFML